MARRRGRRRRRRGRGRRRRAGRCGTARSGAPAAGRRRRDAARPPPVRSARLVVRRVFRTQVGGFRSLAEFFLFQFRSIRLAIPLQLICYTVLANYCFNPNLLSSRSCEWIEFLRKCAAIPTQIERRCLHIHFHIFIPHLPVIAMFIAWVYLDLQLSLGFSCTR